LIYLPILFEVSTEAEKLNTDSLNIYHCTEAASF